MTAGTAEAADTVRIEDLAPDTGAGFRYRVDPMQRTRDKVAIVGFTAHRAQALALDDSWEIWGLNELHRYMPVDRFHRWFEIHARDDLQADPGGPEHLADLGKMDIPVYMHRHWDDIPPSLAFPRHPIVEALGLDYFTCCPAWMIGMAVAMGFKAISVFGVDMATDTEYADQRPCCEFWLGVARGLGIEVTVPQTSDLLKAIGQYGFGREGSLFLAKIDERVKWLHERDNDLLAKLRQLEREYRVRHGEMLGIMHRAQGALGEAQRTEAPPERLEELHGEVQKMTRDLRSLDEEYQSLREKTMAERNQIMGGIQDCQFWRRSWGISGSATADSALPDRTKDPKTGITEVWTPKQPEAAEEAA